MEVKRYKMRQHGIWMIVACALPLLLIFLLPAFGVGSGAYLMIFLIFCFGLHVLMMSGHRGSHDHRSGSREPGDDEH